MVDFGAPVWVGGGAAVFLFIVIAIVVATCVARRKVIASHSRNSRTAHPNNHASSYVPQHPIQIQRNPHMVPNPYQTPYQQPTYPHHAYHQTHHQVHHQQHFHQPPHALQPVEQPHNHHHHHHAPHTILFPAQPVQTYFPAIPGQQIPSMEDDHSLRPGLSDTISLDELNSFDAKGDDREAPCPICLAPLEEEPVSTGNCLHLAHTSCLKSWLVKDSKFACPVCRVPFTDTSNDDVAIALAAPG